MSNGVVVPRHRKIMSEYVVENSMVKAVTESIKEVNSRVPLLQADDIAIIALMAIRDFNPTEEMMSAMWSMRCSNTRDSFRECWKSLIDAGIRGTSSS